MVRAPPCHGGGRRIDPDPGRDESNPDGLLFFCIFGYSMSRLTSVGILQGVRRMTDYPLLAEQLKALKEAEPWYVALFSNASALLWDALPDINWAGFYLMREGELVLGPFQGKTACIRIKVGKGVCGTAVAENQTQLVRDVHRFPGHIACDGASNSEIVIPLHQEGKLYGVLDIDSPSVARFTEEDREGLEKFVAVLESGVRFS